MSTFRPILVTVALAVGAAIGVLLFAGPADAAAPALAEPGMLKGMDVVKVMLSLTAAAIGVGLIGYAMWPAPEARRVRSDSAPAPLDRRTGVHDHGHPC